MTKSDNPMFDNKELVIGKLEPGKSRTVTAPLGWCEIEGRKIGSTAPLPKDAPRSCRIPRDALARSDGITVKFDEARGRAPAPPELRVGIKALDRPSPLVQVTSAFTFHQCHALPGIPKFGERPFMPKWWLFWR